MSENDKKAHFRKTLDIDLDNPSENSKASNQIGDLAKQRQKAKMELINKFNMSEQEAEETLLDIEKKAKSKKTRQMTDEQKRRVQQNQFKSTSDQSSPDLQQKSYQYKRNQAEYAESEKQSILQEKRVETEKMEIQKQKETAKIEENPIKDSEKERLLKEINGEGDIITPQHIQDKGAPKVDDSLEESKDSSNDENSSSDFSYDSLLASKPVGNSVESNEEKSSVENSKTEAIKEPAANKASKTEAIKEPAADKAPAVDEKKESNIDEGASSEKESKDVDALISDIIPDYEKELCIVVDNVSLSFDVESERIDNLKEYFIRTIKRNKSKKRKFNALKDISFEIYKGDKIGVIGYNGAGKSTLLNVITGIYPPETGTVKTYGRISPLLSLGAGFDRNYTGRENIFLNGAVLGYDKKFLESKFDEIVEFSELEDFLDLQIKNYSSGMLAKLGFSIATIVEPDILIIDEVLGVGDVNFRKKSKTKLRSLMDGGTTVILVSHSIGDIRSLCDKAIWIDQGRLREMGDVNKVCDHYIKDAEKADKEQIKNIKFR